MELKQVLHFYLGCEVSTPYEPVAKKLFFTGIRGNDYHVDTEKTIGLYSGGYNYRIDQIKPILRPLSSMTEEHRKELFKIVFKRDFPDSGQTIFYDKRTTLQEPRWVLSSGCDRLGIQFNGDIWADCDLHPFKQNPHLLTLKLCEWGYDIFFLIPEGKAIDATSLTQQQ